MTTSSHENSLQEWGSTVSVMDNILTLLSIFLIVGTQHLCNGDDLKISVHSILEGHDDMEGICIHACR